MTSRFHILQTTKLAIPLIIAQVGHIVTGMVDNMFLGKFFGETEQAAGIISNQIFTLLLVFEIGISFAITPQISDAHINRQLSQKAGLFKNGLLALFMVSLICFIFFYFSTPLIAALGQPGDVVSMAIPFFRVLALSIIPISVFFVCKQYCEGLGYTKPSMYISIVGNLLNILLNYFLIKGVMFFPNLGYMGSCWATFYARCLMSLLFLLLIFLSPSLHPGSDFFRLKFSFRQSFQIIKVGLGSGFQFVFEVAAFVICGLMCGAFGKRAIDAHGISMGIAAFTYMFGSGISGAATIRVSQYRASQNLSEMRNAGLASFKLVLICMGFFALLFAFLHSYLPQYFTSTPEIIALSSNLLIIAGLFQLFDGVQVTGLGVLRGMEDIRYPTMITFIGYWIIAIPLAWLLAFRFQLGVYGVWFALCASLIFVAFTLYFRFNKLTRTRT